MIRLSGSKGFFYRWGQLIYNQRWSVAVASIIVFSCLVLFARELPNKLHENGFTPQDSESNIGYERMQEELDIDRSSLTVVYTSDKLDLTDQKQVDVIFSSLSKVRDLPYINKIKAHSAGRLKNTNHVQAIQIGLDLDESKALYEYPKIRRLIHAPKGMKVYVDGGVATLYDIQKATKRDLMKAEMLGLPAALIVLFIIFGTVIAAILPVIIGLVSVTITLGLTFFIADVLTLSNFLPNIVTMVGLAIGIDYALFIVSRFREELKKQRSVEAAIAMTSHNAGKSIFFSGFAVLIGMFGMLFIDLPIMRALCIGGVLVVLVTVILSNTLLLALLAIIGKRVNRLQVFPALQKKWNQSTFWEKVAFAVMKRPKFLAMFISGMLILLMLPIGGMKLGVPNAEVLPPSYESRQGSDMFEKTFDVRETQPINILVKTKEPYYKEGAVKSIEAYSKKVRNFENVNEVRTFITALGNQTPENTSNLLENAEQRKAIRKEKLAKGNNVLMVVIPKSQPDSADTADLINKLRQLDSKLLDSYVTGAPTYQFDMIDRINKGLPMLIVFVIAVTYLVLLAAFKSVLLPLKAVLMNILSLGSSLGIVVIIFQEGHLAELLQVTSTGYVSIIMPVTIFCVVFGISMDYEVFLISRIMEEYDQTGDNELSTATGLSKTGGFISSAALILIVVVGSFIFTDIEITKALGIGLFSAIFIDATFIRIIVVPALMKLLGNANWWAPRWLFGR